MGRQEPRRQATRHKSSGTPMLSLSKVVLPLHSAPGRKGELWGLKSVPYPDVRASVSQRRGEKSVCLCEISRFLNTGSTFFSTMCKFNETCPMLPICPVSYYNCLILAIKPLSIFHFLDKDLIIKTISLFFNTYLQSSEL